MAHRMKLTLIGFKIRQLQLEKEAVMEVEETVEAVEMIPMVMVYRMRKKLIWEQIQIMLILIVILTMMVMR